MTPVPFATHVALRSIGATYPWWRDQAIRLEAAGYDGVACWDHFISRGVKTDPVVECWTTLTGVAAVTTRLRVMPFVLNVMNRHPAVVARAAATLQEVASGRLTLGIGIGGHPVEHHAYGIPYPDVAERVARLEEAVAVLRALWTGGPVTGRARSTRSRRPMPSRSRSRCRRSSSAARRRPGRGWRRGSGTAGRAARRPSPSAAGSTRTRSPRPAGHGRP